MSQFFFSTARTQYMDARVIRPIVVGRDYGDRLEVVSGLQEGDFIIESPGDVAREGLKVEPVPVVDAARTKGGK